MLQLVYVFECRSEAVGRVRLGGNLYLVAAVFISILLQLMVICTFLGKVFQTVSLGWFHWVLILVVVFYRRWCSGFCLGRNNNFARNGQELGVWRRITVSRAKCLFSGNNGVRRKMRSMTGYGRGEGMWEGEHFQVEVRSLNHRYLECSIQIPKQYSYLQEKIRSTVQRYVTRGRVEVNVSALGEKSEAKEVRVDKDLALAYYNALKELSNYLQLDLEVDIKAIADFPDVFLVEEKEPDQENSQRALEIALTAALEDLVAMRAAEGEKLQEDIIHRIAIIEQVIKDIEERAPQVVVEYRNGLKQRMENF